MKRRGKRSSFWNCGCHTIVANTSSRHISLRGKMFARDFQHSKLCSCKYKCQKLYSDCCCLRFVWHSSSVRVKSRQNYYNNVCNFCMHRLVPVNVRDGNRNRRRTQASSTSTAAKSKNLVCLSKRLCLSCVAMRHLHSVNVKVQNRHCIRFLGAEDDDDICVSDQSAAHGLNLMLTVGDCAFWFTEKCGKYVGFASV